MKLVLAAALLSFTPALAQQQVQARQLLGPVKHAGVYHVATGSWSRPGPLASLGSDVIYSATRFSGYFGVGWEGSTGVDEGVLPGPGHPMAGAADSYRIDGFEFAYCSSAFSLDFTFFFLDSYVPCDAPYTPSFCQNNASGDIVVAGLPTSGSCWTVTIDLSGGAEFCLQADGGPCAPGYQGAGSLQDHFGIAHTWVSGGGGTTGLIIAGYDPSWGTPGEGTCYGPAATCPTGDTALGARDLFAIEGGAFAPGCVVGSGYVNSNGCTSAHNNVGWQFHLSLFTDCHFASCDDCEASYCDTNPDQVGTLSIDTCDLSATGMTITASATQNVTTAYLLVSADDRSVTDPPGALGDLCLAGPLSIGRYVLDLRAPNGSGTWSVDLIGGATGGGVGALPDPPGGVLQPGETWSFQGWGSIPGGSRFTSALRVTFE